jgi:hypothetical protein
VEFAGARAYIRENCNWFRRGVEMTEREKDVPDTDEVKQRTPGRELHLKPAGEAHVKPLESPIAPDSDKRIHARRPLPLVPEHSSDKSGADQIDEDQ